MNGVLRRGGMVLLLTPLFALAACGLVYVFLWRTRWGYELRATGSNPSAAEYGGISVRRQIVLAMAISGGLAGMVGINEWSVALPEAPFGGMKQSGLGRESGPEGVHEYLEPKTRHFGGVV